MRQYHALKAQAPQALLMFRLGDFYELFYEDAVVAARELEITLTARHKEKDQPVPMCGVPYHTAETYIARLVRKGYRVAICDQMEAPSGGKKLVRRELTRIITPGTATTAAVLEPGANNWLAALAEVQGRTGLALADVSTGEFRVTETDPAGAQALIESLGVREILAAGRAGMEPWMFAADYGDRLLRDHFRLLTLAGCGLEGRAAAVAAAGAVLHYLRETQRSALDHLDRPAWFERSASLVLDAVTIRNLELVEPLFADVRDAKQATLLGAIDQTTTPLGARLLRRRILAPSRDRAEIEARLDGVAALHAATMERAEIRRVLKRVLDLERLLAKTTLGTATPRDVLALGQSLNELPALNKAAEKVSGLPSCPDRLEDLASRVLDTLAAEPPVHLADGGTIRSGRNAELDELRALQTNSRQVIAALEARERQRTNIQSLKVRFNQVFGYYLEVSRPNLALVPPEYERKQTLVNAERFTTPELKALELKILEAGEKILAIEREMFESLRAEVAAHAARIRQAAAWVAEIDVSAALAEVAAGRRWVRPQFSTDGTMKIEAGRHPVIEILNEQAAQPFTPNDLYLDRQKFLAVLTGPNMGGKSTYLRQTALMTILAQAGSFVPAQAALLPVIDRVFTRIGAADNLARGRSTFMVEMTETALILNTATPDSLIVLDEIGRGTATYDGLAIAWAVVEYIHHHIGAKTLFATHYHELTELEQRLAGVINLKVGVKESGDQILFLRKVQPGAADRSFGIEVARLAGLPPTVIDRARAVLAVHERTERRASAEIAPSREAMQIRLFEPVNGAIAARIRALRLDELRPIEALQLLAELQRELE